MPTKKTSSNVEDTKKATTKKTTTAKKTTTKKVEEKAPVKKTTAKKPASKENLKVLFVAGEATPFIKTGGLADVVGTLPTSLVKKGIDARVFIPLYGKIKENFKNKLEFRGSMYINLSWRSEYAGVFQMEYNGVTYYFLDNERYFKRGKIYGEYDDGERFAFFSKAVLDCLKIIDFKPNIIHANDWHTGLVPVYLDCFFRNDEYCKDAKTVYTIHNIEFQGKYNPYIIGDLLGLNIDQGHLVEYKDNANYMKGGIESATKVTTVSNTYAEEILNPYFGYGMQDILHDRKYKLSGIINGISLEENNPLTDKFIYQNYDLSSIEKKAINKTRLQSDLGLNVDENIPLIAMVGRLSHQKGIDLVTAGMERIMSLGCQVAILGSGDEKYECALRELEKKYKGNLVAYIGFSVDLASKLYAASDMFLMPSQFEPCGLSQMIAMRFGSIPIVRETGGLKDTVAPYNHETGDGVGFTFKTYNVEDMTYAVERAVGLYKYYKDDWKKVLENAMKKDFSWDSISNKYVELYKSIL